MRERDHDLLRRHDGRRDRVRRDARLPQKGADDGRLAPEEASGRRSRGRLGADRKRPPDEVGADRHPRRARDVERVVRVADVVDRAREDMRRQHDRHRNCSKAEEEFWEHKRAWTPFHRPTMTGRGNATV